jgi:DNA-directed RNA polymerase subunit H (RpoH/RPB5)
MSKKTETDIEKFIPELLPIEKSIYQQINDVKTTIVKIFTNRGFINNENRDKYINKLIENENDDMEYIINIDNKKNYNTEIKNKKIYMKIFNYKISSINDKSPLGEFIKKYDKEYKFIVVQGITSKTEEMISIYNTQVEIFKFNKLQSDITEHDLVPLHQVLTKEEGENVLESYRAKKRDMPLIRTNEDVAKYYNMKPGEITRIYRPSPITGEAVAYRLVIKSTDSKVKT